MDIVYRQTTFLSINTIDESNDVYWEFSVDN